MDRKTCAVMLVVLFEGLLADVSIPLPFEVVEYLRTAKPDSDSVCCPKRGLWWQEGRPDTTVYHPA